MKLNKLKVCKIEIDVKGSSMKKLAKFWEKQPDKKVRCTLCPWRCTVAPGKLGTCRSRKNEGGEFFTLVYGPIVSMATAI